MKKNKEQLGLEFWERMNTLIGDERPYSWAVRHDIPKGSFQSAYERKAKPLDKTLDKWAELIGVNAHWLKTGQGNPQVPTITLDLPPEYNDHQQAIQNISMGRLMEALIFVDEFLEETNRTMTAEHKAELVIKVCHLLAIMPELDDDQKQALKDPLKIA